MKTFDRFMTCLTGSVFLTVVELIFGKVDRSLIVLLIVMFLDLLTGILSGASKGMLSSNKCFDGLKRKLFILIYVLIANQLDILLNVEYIRMSVCFMYIINETISIIENGTKLGVPIPEPIKKALKILNNE